ncbi:MAG: polysaccharide deacetylase family protein [Proteobacteria bacterium]|nr:polysaccharide deacetylase family protein [Pseudomonadota bacterium]
MKTDEFYFKIIKQNVKKILSSTLSIAGFYKHLHMGEVIILMYHRVLPKKQFASGNSQANIIVSAESFEENIRYLKKQYKIISFNDFFDMKKQHTWSKKERYAILTFDDGWEDNYYFAFPILKRYHVKATIFIATGYIGTDRHFFFEGIGESLLNLCSHPEKLTLMKDCFQEFDLNASQLKLLAGESNLYRASRIINGVIHTLKTKSPHLLEQLSKQCTTSMHISHLSRTMNWEQIGEMSNSGIDFGAHTINHYILPELSLTEAENEINMSKKDIDNRSINTAPVFSYPNGSYNNDIINLTKKAGYKGAVAVNPGSITFMNDSSLFELPRINILPHIADSKKLFQFKLFKAKV